MEKNNCIYEERIDYEAECERLSMIILKQNEVIKALKEACFGMADALRMEVNE
jgi:hypothetical protein